MAKKNTKPKAEAIPEDELNTVQQATEDEQNASQQVNEDEGAGSATPSGVDDATSPVEGEVKGGTEELSAAPVKLVVISARGLALRQEPSKQSDMLAVLSTGMVLTARVAEVAAEGWIPVTTRDGKNGWVDCRFVTVVD